MKQELVRINSIDGIEMVGILYKPEETSNTIVIHVHGLCGNFYENRFLKKSRIFSKNPFTCSSSIFRFRSSPAIRS